MQQVTDIQQFWFAARVRHSQEFAVRDTLLKFDIICYVPTHIVVRELKYRRVQVEVPVISNLIFVYATKERACAAANDFGIPLYYMQDASTHAMLVIPDKQMDDFRFVMEHGADEVTIDDAAMVAGDKVLVMKGDFSGVRGEMVRISSHTHVLIRIPQILSAVVRVPKSYLKIEK
ncbi:MAG: UpxY family transcription antiterminator [Alistipes sp.]